MKTLVERCAGIDVGKKFVVVCVLTGGVLCYIETHDTLGWHSSPSPDTFIKYGYSGRPYTIQSVSPVLRGVQTNKSRDV